MSIRQIKKGVYNELAKMGKAFSSPVRLEIIDLLCQGPKNVEQLSKEIDQSVANTSQHLQTLRSAGLIKSERNGNFILYRVANTEVAVVWSHVRSLGESSLSEIKALTQQYSARPDSLEKFSQDELVKLVAEDRVLLLDVRPEAEYQEAHLGSAVSIPLDRLLSEISRLPQDKTIVAYCRGPLCLMALEAVELLSRRGFHAVRLEDSVADWRAKGLPVEERLA